MTVPLPPKVDMRSVLYETVDGDARILQGGARSPIAVPLPPPKLARDLLAGTRLVAGLGFSVVIPSFDFETYSEAGYDWDNDQQCWCRPGTRIKTTPSLKNPNAGLGVIGAAVYAQHPSTEVLCMAYNLKDGRGPQQWLPDMPPPVDLFESLQGGNLLGAWNSPFEGWIWNEVCVRRYGWPPLDLRQLRCDMAKARAWGLPGKLAESAKVIGVPIQKDTEGERLLNKFSLPRNPTQKDPRRRIRPEEDPEDAKKLYSYNVTDIDTEDEVSARVPDLEGEELEFWLAAWQRQVEHILMQQVRQTGVGFVQALDVLTHARVEQREHARALEAEVIGRAASKVPRLAAGQLDDGGRRATPAQHLVLQFIVRALRAERAQRANPSHEA